MKKKNVIIVALVTILVFGGVLRFVSLDRELIFDDIFSIHYSSLPVSDIVYYTAQDLAHVPLYYILLHYWMELFGSGDRAVKLLSVLMSLGSIVALYFLGKLLFSKKVGLIAALILSVSSIDILLSGDVRPYSLIILLVILSAYFFIRYVKTSRISYLSVFLVFCFLGIYTHFEFWFAVVAFNLFILVYRKRYRNSLRQWFFGQGVLLTTFLPWFLYSVLPNLRDGVIGDSMISVVGEAYTRMMVVDIPLNFILMPRFLEGASFYGGVVWYTFFCAIVVAAFFTLKKERLAFNKEHGTERSILLMLVVVPLLSFIFFVVPIPKYYIVGTAPLYLFAAYGVFALVKRTKLIIGIVALVAASTFLFMPQLIALTDDHTQEQAMEYITSHSQDEDTILVHHFRARLVFDRYYTGQARVVGVYPNTDTGNLNYEIARYNSQLEPIVTEENVDMLDNMKYGANRIWLYSSEASNPERKSGALIRTWLESKGWREADQDNKPYGFITLYEKDGST